MLSNRVSTGIPGFDEVIDHLRIGDNVVWQVGSIHEYQQVVSHFAVKSREEGKRLVYCRFGSHAPLLSSAEVDQIYTLEADKGFESFATAVHHIITSESEGVFYVFDCLSDLLEHWYSDLMIGNFFRVSCPALYELKTVAYFALMRGTHTNATIARIRATTQVLLDVHQISGCSYVHPLKVFGRYSPTMFFPHQLIEDAVSSVTASADAAELFSREWQLHEARDYWDVTLDQAKTALAGSSAEQERMKNLLIDLLLGRAPEIRALCRRYFALSDLLYIASREIGTGRVGGKSVGFLLARQIIKQDSGESLRAYIEPHDSYYIGSDVFYTYLVENGYWKLRMEQKTPQRYFECAEDLKQGLLTGTFSDALQEKFSQMLEYYGQSPIIVRSSSLQEDGYGNAFAGKYTSVFCANQGTPEERYTDFENAVRTVYASIMNEDALLYRRDRGLTNDDEQMAVLVQRVSGDHYGRYFFPHVAGVANSVNLYLWSPQLDPAAGMLRLAFGLGTRAVDRVSGDYIRLVALDKPQQAPPVDEQDKARYSQHKVDVIDLQENMLSTVPVSEVTQRDLKTKKTYFFALDEVLEQLRRERGEALGNRPYLVDFDGLLSKTNFASVMRDLLTVLQKAFDHPVDVEFTCNFSGDDKFHINIVQCRSLQAYKCQAVALSTTPKEDEIVLQTQGQFVGGSQAHIISAVLYVEPESYLALSEQDKYSVARAIGWFNRNLSDETVMLIGPGRWGTSTPSLGVPVHFSEISNMTALCEIAYGDMLPEPSYGSHFFQDMVESSIFYLALHPHDSECSFDLKKLKHCKHQTPPEAGLTERIEDVVQVFKPLQLELSSDVETQLVLCSIPSQGKDTETLAV